METDIAMPKNDFLQPLLDMMNRRMDDLEKKIDANTKLTQQALNEIKYTNGRVDGQEKDIGKLKGGLAKVERKSGLKLEFNPRLMYVIAVGAVLLLAIIASLLHINIGGLFK